MKREPVWVMVSGTARQPASPAVRIKHVEAIKRLHDCAPDRLVWGSDCPLAAGASGFRNVDNAQEVQLALSASGPWAEHLFHLNPERLFA
jgi:predicted TIM-barrel fold metal-dependent hydrolase